MRQSTSHANRLFVMTDISVNLDGSTQQTPARMHALQQLTVDHLTPPPLLTTVQQLNLCGAPLAKMPTHSTPWCQNTEHSNI